MCIRDSITTERNETVDALRAIRLQEFHHARLGGADAGEMRRDVVARLGDGLYRRHSFLTRGTARAVGNAEVFRLQQHQLLRHSAKLYVAFRGVRREKFKGNIVHSVGFFLDFLVALGFGAAARSAASQASAAHGRIAAADSMASGGTV